MATSSPAQLEHTIDVAAAPAQVWAVVTDLKRMAGWSTHGLRTFVPGGVRQGARFLNLNKQGLKVWPTTGKVVRFTPHEQFAFRITENRVVWAYDLEPTPDGGTRVTHRRETPDGISALSTNGVKIALGGVEQFTADLDAGMQESLRQVKRAAEA